MNVQATSVACLLDDASTRITAALGLEKREARIEARALAAHAWQAEPAWLIAHDTDLLTDTQIAAFQSRLSRRLEGEPVAYILRAREFFGLTLQVTPDVLIPRPDTETLVQAVLDQTPADRPCRILDLGTGSGAIALALATHRPLAQILAVDRSSAALGVARNNAIRLGLKNVTFILSDWYTQLGVRNFDIIAANPPYISMGDTHLNQGDLRFEPVEALQSDDGGLADIRRIVAGAPLHLSQGGWLLFEHGYDQEKASQALLRQAGWFQVHTRLDLSGLPRVSGGQRL
ncbi:MAG: peptide chain release factor N(5)-glutamine methyltransferase [Thiobacillus sp.]